jgi:hypothetical protein
LTAWSSGPIIHLSSTPHNEVTNHERPPPQTLPDHALYGGGLSRGYGRADVASTDYSGDAMSQNAIDLLGLAGETFPGAQAERRRIAANIIAAGVSSYLGGC